MATTFTLTPTHRQHMEAVRDALHLWVVANASLGLAHPMYAQMLAWRDEITETFVEAQG